MNLGFESHAVRPGFYQRTCCNFRLQGVHVPSPALPANCRDRKSPDGEQWGAAGAAFTGHLCSGEARACSRERPQAPQCRRSPGRPCPARAVLLGCKEAHPANPDGWEENQLPAFLIKTFCVVGVFSPSFHNFPAELSLSPGLDAICLAAPGAVPGAAQEPLVSPRGARGCSHRDVCVSCSSPVSLLCLATAAPRFLNLGVHIEQEPCRSRLEPLRSTPGSQFCHS
ncbi:uncharacterized protein LOC113975938 [Neopelma chrysocephalum]|uniref:uncharacterized protein LOC113975938 n=1 Tax=Neopelma chrysocephalum TaxID=114329 RepID=UPI000FCD3C81|nr:uncharacterized protein LOC113975938 [Neopelma chrysocephalum]